MLVDDSAREESSDEVVNGRLRHTSPQIDIGSITSLGRHISVEDSVRRCTRAGSSPNAMSTEEPLPSQSQDTDAGGRESDNEQNESEVVPDAESEEASELSDSDSGSSEDDEDDEEEDATDDDKSEDGAEESSEQSKHSITQQSVISATNQDAVQAVTQSMVGEASLESSSSEPRLRGMSGPKDVVPVSHNAPEEAAGQSGGPGGPGAEEPSVRSLAESPSRGDGASPAGARSAVSGPAGATDASQSESASEPLTMFNGPVKLLPTGQLGTDAPAQLLGRASPKGAGDSAPPPAPEEEHMEVQGKLPNGTAFGVSRPSQVAVEALAATREDDPGAQAHTTPPAQSASVRASRSPSGQEVAVAWEGGGDAARADNGLALPVQHSTPHTESPYGSDVRSGGSSTSSDGESQDTSDGYESGSVLSRSSPRQVPNAHLGSLVVGGQAPVERSNGKVEDGAAGSISAPQEAASNGNGTPPQPGKPLQDSAKEDESVENKSPANGENVWKPVDPDQNGDAEVVYKDAAHDKRSTIKVRRPTIDLEDVDKLKRLSTGQQSESSSTRSKSDGSSTSSPTSGSKNNLRAPADSGQEDSDMHYDSTRKVGLEWKAKSEAGSRMEGMSDLSSELSFDNGPFSSSRQSDGAEAKTTSTSVNLKRQWSTGNPLSNPLMRLSQVQIKSASSAAARRNWARVKKVSQTKIYPLVHGHRRLQKRLSLTAAVSFLIHGRSKSANGILRMPGDTPKDKHKRHVRFLEPKKAWIKKLPLFVPEDRFSERWETIVMIPLTYEVAAFPLRLALGDPGLSQLSIMFVVSTICEVAYYVDALVILNTVVHVKKTAAKGSRKSALEDDVVPKKDKKSGRKKDKSDPNVITNRWKIARHYFVNTFPYTLLPCMPMYWFELLVSMKLVDHTPGTVTMPSIWIWWILTLPRIYIRATRLYQYFQKMELRLEVNVFRLQLYRFMAMIFLASHWVGCTFYFLARLQGFSQDTWIVRFQHVMPLFNLDTSSMAQRYIVIMYKGFNVLSNISYESVVPDNEWEVIFSIMVTYIQVALGAYVLGTLFNYIVQKDASTEQYFKQMEEVEDFMEARRLPADLVEGMRRHFKFQRQKAKRNKASTFVSLPRSLAVKVANAQYREVVDKSCVRGGAFFGCNNFFLDALMVKLHEKYLMPGEEFIRKGDMARELSFVLGGKMQVVEAGPEGETILKTIRADIAEVPSIVGEVAFFMGVVQPDTVKAQNDGDAKVITLSKQDYEDLITRYPEQHDIVTGNLLLPFGLDKQGNEEGAATTAAAHDENEDLSFEEVKTNIKSALKRRVDDDFSMLMFAAQNGDLEECSSILRRGLDVNMVDYDGHTTLHMAAKCGMYKVVELLLEAGADKDAVDRWGNTPLQVAIMNQQSPVAELLTSWKATLQMGDPAGALCDAASTGNMVMLQRLLEHGVDPNVGDYDNRTPFHLAAAEGQQKAVEYLLNAGAKVNVKDRWGGTPLMDAISSGQPMVCRMLRQAGGTMPSTWGAEKLCTAASEGDVPLLTLLAESDVNMSEGDYDGRCAMHLAAAEAHLCAVSYLLSNSADPNCVDRWGNTPLVDALRGGTAYHLYCAKLIQSAGGVLGVLEDTEEGVQLTRLLEAITMAEVREKLAYLIKNGYNRIKPTHVTVEAMALSMDATHELISNTRAVAVVFNQLKFMVLTELQQLKKSNADTAQSVQSIASTLMTICRASTQRESTTPTKAGEVSARAKAIPQRVVHLEVDNLMAGFFENLQQAQGKVEQELLHSNTVTLPSNLHDEFFSSWNQTGGGNDVDLEKARIANMEDEAEDMMPQDSDEESNLTLQQRLDIVARKFQKQIMRVHVVEEAVLCVQETFRDVARMRKSFGGFDALIDSPSLTREKRSEGSRDSWLSRNLAGMRLPSMGRSPLPKAPPAQPAELPLNKIRLNEECLVQVLEKMGVSARRADVSKMAEEFFKHQTSTGTESTETKFTAHGLIAGSKLFRQLFLDFKAPSDTADLRRRLSIASTGSGVVDITSSDVTDIKKGFQIISSLWSLLLEAHGYCSPEPDGTGRAVSKRSLQRFSESLGEVGKEVFMRAIVKPFAKDMADLKAAKQSPQENGVQADEGEAAEEEEDTSTLLLSVDQYWFYWMEFITGIDDQEQQDRREGVRSVSASKAKDMFREFTQPSWAQHLSPSPAMMRTLRWLLLTNLWYPSIEPELFTEEALAGYEFAFLRMTGSLQKVMRKKDVGMFLEMLFPSFSSRHGISRHHCKEFMRAFKIPTAQRFVDWNDMRRTIREFKAMEKEHSESRVFLDGRILNPHSSLMLQWQSMLRMSCTFVFFAVPFFIGFQPDFSLASVATIMSVVVHDLIFFTHMLITFNMAYTNKRSVLVRDRWKICKHYLSEDFAIDLMAVIPLDMFAIALGAGQRTASWLQIPKLLRINRVRVHIHSQLGNSASSRVRLMILGYSIVLFHFCACVWFSIGELPGDTWYTQYNTQVLECEQDPDPSSILIPAAAGHMATCDILMKYGQEGSTVWQKYIRALHWVSATVSSNGLVGHLLPVSFTEVLFTIMLMFLNMTVVAYISGEIAGLVMSADEKVIAMREEMVAVQNYIKSKNLPEQLQEEVKAHIYATQKGKQLDMGWLYSVLSYSLQVKVATHLSREFLDQVSLFNNCHENFMDSLSVLLRESKYDPEEYLFRKNETSREMYFIMKGRLEILTDGEYGEAVTSTCKPGDSCGDLSFFFGMRHINTARVPATSPCYCFTLQKHNFNELLKLYPDEEQIVAQNALCVFDAEVKTGGSTFKSFKGGMSRTPSGAGSDQSGKSGRSTFDITTNSQVAATIKVLQQRRQNDRIAKLFEAVKRNNLAEVKRIMKAGEVAVNEVNYDNRSALHIACSEGRLDIVRALVEMGANSLLADMHGNTPLNDAVEHKHDEVAEYLRSSQGCRLQMQGADAAVKMCEAAAKGSLIDLQRMVLNGINPSESDYDQRTALHLAASEGHVHIVEYLLRMGADIHAKDRFGGLPLQDAIRHNQMEVQMILVKAGTKVGGISTACQMCEVAARGDVDTLHILCGCGVDPNTSDYDNRTALHLAASNGQLTVLDYLLSIQPPIDVNPVDRLGGTPLSDAIRHNNPVATRMLEMAGGMKHGDPRLEEIGFGQEQRRKARAKQERHAAVLVKVAESPEMASMDSAQNMVNELQEKVPNLLDEFDSLTFSLHEALSALEKDMIAHGFAISSQPMFRRRSIQAEEFDLSKIEQVLSEIHFNSQELWQSTEEMLQDLQKNHLKDPRMLMLASGWNRAVSELKLQLAVTAATTGILHLTLQSILRDADEDALDGG